jgi:hypothetical protein
LGSYILKAFVRGVAIMGGRFIIDAAVVGGGFRGILVLMCSGL